MKTIFAGGLILLAACTNAPNTSRPAASPSPSVRSWVGLAGAPVAFSCNLPVTNTRPGGGGFVHFPGGRYTPDPASDRSYVARLRKWIPVPLSQLSPDERTFVVQPIDYTAPSGMSTIEIVDIATGKTSRLWQGPGYVDILGYDAQGIHFLRHANQVADPVLTEVTIWTAKPSQPGVATSLSYAIPVAAAGGGWWPLHDGGLWGGGPFSETAGGVDTSPDLFRLDLRSGAVQHWFSAANTIVQLLGFDVSGAVLIRTLGGETRGAITTVYRLAAPYHTEVISVPSWLGVALNDPVSDTHGVWFGRSDGAGIELYNGGAITEVARIDLTKNPYQSVRKYASSLPSEGAPLPPPPYYNVAGPCR